MLAHDLLLSMIEVDCPRCEFPFEVQFLDAKCQVWRRCPCCRINIHLTEGTGEVHGAMKDVDSAMNELYDAIDGLNDMFKGF